MFRNLLLTLFSFVVSVSLSSQTTIFVSDFETCDAAFSYDGTQVPYNNTINPYSGTNHGRVDGGCSGGSAGCFDGSIITPLLTFYPGCSYTIKVYAAAVACASELEILKATTATNAALNAATGSDRILDAGTNVTSVSYNLITASFTVSATESKYIGFHMYSAGSGGCSGRRQYIDKIIITKDCPTCQNGTQDGSETSVDCGGICDASAPSGGSVSPASASYACGSGSFTLCLSGHSGHIQWQYSLTGSDPWYDISEANNTTYAGNVRQTTYFRAKLTKDGCTPTPAYSNTSTITITGSGSKTWLTTGTSAWGTGTNWSPNGAPGNCDDVTIPSGGTQPTISGSLTAQCRSITVNGSLTITGSVNTLFEVYGDFINNGTVTHNSSAYKTIRLNGPTNKIGGTGTWSGTQGPIVDFRAGANYTLVNDIYTYFAEINSTASISLQSYRFICDVASGFNQSGIVNINTGILEIRGSGAIFTAEKLNHNRGTFYQNYQTQSVSLNFTDDDFYNWEAEVGGGYYLQMAADRKVANNFTLVSGELRGSTYTITVGENGQLFSGFNGNFTKNGTFTANTGKVLMKGAVAQNIQGTSATTFYNLEIDNSGTGVTQVQPVTVSNILTLTNGAFKLNSLTATVTNSATAAIASTSGYAQSENESSKLQWNIGTATGVHTFPFGYNGSYLPYYLDVTSAGTGAGNFAISTWYTAANATVPSGTTVCSALADPDEQYATDRFWVITPSGYTTVPTSTVRFPYLTGELDGIAEADLKAQRWNSASAFSCKWDLPVGTVNTGSDYVEITGVSNFSPWVLSKGPTPLPIELLSFNAYPDKNIVQLNWSTANEINNDYFTIERSKDGQNWEAIASVDGAGNSNHPIDYLSYDNKPYTGISYYRLKQTDYDGQYKYFNVVTVNREKEAETGVAIYPNPAGNGLFFVAIKGNSEDKSVHLSLRNTLGQLVYSEKLLVGEQPENIIPVSLGKNFPCGLYFFEIASDKQYYSQRLILK